MTLVVSLPAQLDLIDISNHLLRTAGPTVATRVVAALHAAMARLAGGSAVGHPRPDLAPAPTQFYLVFRYLIVHRADRGSLEVVRVLHSARDVQSLLA